MIRKISSGKRQGKVEDNRSKADETVKTTACARDQIENEYS